MQVSSDIAANLAKVQARLDRAAQQAHRSAEEITLVAVTKTKPVSSIRAALAAGQLDFGENRPEDAWAKFADPDSPEALPNMVSQGRAAYRLHLIGPIQSRKAALAVACQPVLIHSLDRLKIARRLERFAAEADLVLKVLLEVNISGEASKFGFQPDVLLASAGELLTLRHIRVQGLMTMPPYDPDPETARPFFVQLRRLRDQLAQRYPAANWQHLSMGMSHDFEVAIEEGATIVRVGTAIFGER
jgi:pyridoxal phosphate enzyme (YggS family)